MQLYLPIFHTMNLSAYKITNFSQKYSKKKSTILIDHKITARLVYKILQQKGMMIIMKIAICDENEQDCLTIKKICETNGYPDIHLFQSGNELLACPHLNNLNILFLNIELNGLSGIEIMHQLEIRCPFTLIVFTASHNDLMSDAFGRNVISFMLKPFQEISIISSIKKAEYLSIEFTPIKINSKIFLPCSNILYLEYKQKYSTFIDINGQSYLSHNSLIYWCKKLLPHGFSQISRSNAINLKYYKGIHEKKVLLINNTQLDVSRRYLSVLKENHNAYMLRLARTECQTEHNSFRTSQAETFLSFPRAAACPSSQSMSEQYPPDSLPP